MAEAKKPAAKKKTETIKVEEKVAKNVTTKVTTKEKGTEKEAELKDSKAGAQDKDIVETAPKATAKAGKRSDKALKEAEEKQAKEERKALAKENAAEEAAKPKVIVTPTRPRILRRSKAYQKASEQIDKTKAYSLNEAVELCVKSSTVKFDATVELHARLGVDPRQADQNIRQTVVLPAGSGKNVRVAVFADGDEVAKAKKAGADIAGSDEFLQQLDKETIDFDILIATPSMMPKLGKYARLLGPKGLMPNPKSGTVTTAIEKAVLEAKAGRQEYRVDSTGIVHLGIGKVSFGNEKLTQNARAIFASIKAAKPASLKGNYVNSIYLTTTMGPSIRVEVAELNN